MNAIALPASRPAGLVPRYVRDGDPRDLLDSRVLALFGFGRAAPTALDDPRYLHIGLESTDRAAWYEVWTCTDRVQPWRTANARGACGSDLSFGWIELAEGASGIAGAAEAAYRELLQSVGNSAHPQLLRIWNYLDAITEGDGDDERYRQFCAGRAAGLAMAPERYPAATAIGRRDGRRVLQVYWLSARNAGTPLENPRQVAAWTYPREYGPRPPTFARAMLPPADLAMPMMLSGTAAVVGHASQHAGDLQAQLDETLRNCASMIDVARQHRPGLPAAFDSGSLLKVYVASRPAQTAADLLAMRLPLAVPRLVLEADVCRSDLAIEIDGFHGS